MSLSEGDEFSILGSDSETTAGYVRFLGLGSGERLDCLTTPNPVSVTVRVRRSDRRILEMKHPDYGKPEVAQDDLPLKVLGTNEMLRFLYDYAEGPDYVVFWNLGFDFAAIVKLYVEAHADQLRKTHYANVKRRQRLNELGLKEEEGLSARELRERQELTSLLDGEDNVERFTTEEFFVQLIGGKGFSLRPLKRGHKGKGQANRRWFFDASAWYSSAWGGMKLDTAGRKFLGRGKTDSDLAVDRERIGNEYGYYEAHHAAIAEYCVDDCKLTSDLMALTIRGFLKLGLPFPEKPFSRASVSREYFRTMGVLNETRDRYQMLRKNAYNSLWNKSFRGGIFLLTGVGVWHDPYSLDINSAYPYAMADFPSLEDAEVVDRDDPRFEECYFTFYRIRLKPTPRTPTRVQGDRRKIYGWSEEECSMAVTGIDLAVLSKMGEKFVIEDGCGVWTPHPNDRPLAYLKAVYDRKSAVKKEYGANSVEYANIKIFLNGSYGILAQRKPRESEWTNLIYASYVTATCRRQLWEAVRETEERGDYVVSLATDGLLVVGEKARQYWADRNSTLLGEWSYTPHSEAVCFESGVGFLDEFEVKKRGMPKLTREALLACSEIEWSEVSQRPLKLRSALIQKRVNMLGVFEEHERVLSPVQSFADAGLAFPKDLAKAPLKDYFVRSWRLRLRGQVGDRLTPPSDLTARSAWESNRRKAGSEKGFIYPPRRSSLKELSSGARGTTRTDGGEIPSTNGLAVETDAVPLSVEGGARRSKGKPTDREGLERHPPSGGRDSRVSRPSETEPDAREP